MTEPNLFVVCVVALLAVFTLLGVLAAAMQLLSVLFPEREAGGPDDALLSAVATAAARSHPGMRVTRIEEKA